MPHTDRSSDHLSLNMCLEFDPKTNLYRTPSSVYSSQLSVRVLSRLVGSIVGFGEGVTVEFGSILCVSPLTLALHTVCCLHNSTLHSYHLHYTYLFVPNCYMRCRYSFYLRNIVPSCGHWGLQAPNNYLTYYKLIASL